MRSQCPSRKPCQEWRNPFHGMQQPRLIHEQLHVPFANVVGWQKDTLRYSHSSSNEKIFWYRQASQNPNDARGDQSGTRTNHASPRATRIELAVLEYPPVHSNAKQPRPRSARPNRCTANFGSTMHKCTMLEEKNISFLRYIFTFLLTRIRHFTQTQCSSNSNYYYYFYAIAKPNDKNSSYEYSKRGVSSQLGPAFDATVGIPIGRKSIHRSLGPTVDPRSLKEKIRLRL